MNLPRMIAAVIVGTLAAVGLLICGVSNDLILSTGVIVSVIEMRSPVS